MLKKYVILELSLVLIFLILLSNITSAQADNTVFSFYQGEKKEIVFEDIPLEMRIEGIEFASIEDKKVIINVPQEQKTGVYIGKITADSEEILLAIVVNNRNCPVKTEFILGEKEIDRGKILPFNLNIELSKTLTSSCIPIIYEIKSPNNELILEEQKNEILDSSRIISDSIYIPSSVEGGNYILTSEIKCDSDNFFTAAFFYVDGKTQFQKIPIVNKILLAIIFVVIVYLFFFLYNLDKSLKTSVSGQPKHLEKIYGHFIKTRKKEVASGKLRKQVKLIRSAYKLGMISKKDYGKAKKNINVVSKKIKLK